MTPKMGQYDKVKIAIFRKGGRVGRRFSDEFKAKVALEAIKGQKQRMSLCRFIGDVLDN